MLPTVEELASRVAPVNSASAEEARAYHTQLTKPVGSLGELEILGERLAAIAGTCPPPLAEPAVIGVFAGDHGVTRSGVTLWPSEVTAQMVANFCAGGAAINVLARQVGASVMVVDVGVGTPIPGDAKGLLRRNVALGTRDLALEAAMSLDEAYAALMVGVEVAESSIRSGARLLATGDMGIGNTTPSAALIAAFTGHTAAQVTGRGTGIDDQMLVHKTAVIDTALKRIAPQASALEVLSEVGGLEIAALAGFILGAATQRVPVVIDGVIAVAATVVAQAIAPSVSGYIVAGHLSSEPAAKLGLAHLGVTPLLDLGLRLGEGTGAALAIPLVQAAARVLREMATFASAGVDEATSAS